MTEQDWSDICSILTSIEAAIQCGSYVGTKSHMQSALGIARRRHQEAMHARVSAPQSEEGSR